MSLTATRLALKHRTTIERDTASDEGDPWGGDADPSWELLAEIPCRAWVGAGKEAVTADRTAVIIDLRCMVPSGTDVTEGDRLGDITEHGQVIFEGPHRIEAVLRHPDRIDLMLEQVR